MENPFGPVAFGPVDEVDAESDLALEIMGGSKSANTRLQYKRKVKHFADWMNLKHPECCDESRRVNLALVTKIILKQFLGHICQKKDKSGNYLTPIVFHAFQHVSGYKSAIKDFYLNQEVVWKSRWAYSNSNLPSGRMVPWVAGQIHHGG